MADGESPSDDFGMAARSAPAEQTAAVTATAPGPDKPTWKSLFAALPGHIAHGLTHLARWLTHLGKWVAGLGRRLARLTEIKPTPLQRLALLSGLAAISLFGAVAFAGNPIGQACIIAFVPGLSIAIGILGTRWHTGQRLNPHLLQTTQSAVHATLQLRKSVRYVDDRLSAAQRHLVNGSADDAFVEIARAKTATELSLGIAEVPARQWGSASPVHTVEESRGVAPAQAAADGDFISGSVARVEDQHTVILNRGAVHGIAPDMLFAVLADAGDPILDPETGEVIGELPAEKLRVKVIDVQPKFSRAATLRTSPPMRAEYPALTGYSRTGSEHAGTLDFIDASLSRMLENEFAEPYSVRETIATGRSPQDSPVRAVRIEIGDRVRQVR
ncbi:hypothetical protein ACX9NE_06390 [Mycobacterium sp. ML4]